MIQWVTVEWPSFTVRKSRCCFRSRPSCSNTCLCKDKPPMNKTQEKIQNH